MCHPGYPDDTLVKNSSYALEREKEIAALCNPEVREALVAEGIELITFGALAAGS
jgi:predicted glycoside hydrolase/deacetylase ChbG (UPF0249 family)